MSKLPNVRLRVLRAGFDWRGNAAGYFLRIAAVYDYCEGLAGPIQCFPIAFQPSENLSLTQTHNSLFVLASPYPQLPDRPPLAPNRGPVQFARMGRAVLNQKNITGRIIRHIGSKKALRRPDHFCRYALFCT